MKLDKALNIIISLLVIVLIGLGTYAITTRRNSQSSKATSQSIERTTKKSHHKDSSKKESKTNDESSSKDSDTEVNSNESYSTSDAQDANSTGSTAETKQASQSNNGVVVVDGQNFSYRAAQKLGLIPATDTETSVQDFYSECQDTGDGGFIYKGQRYNGRVLQDGHQDEYHSNIEVTPAN